jgi:hypothetical protein
MASHTFMQADLQHHTLLCPRYRLAHQAIGGLSISCASWPLGSLEQTALKQCLGLVYASIAAAEEFVSLMRKEFQNTTS